MTDQSGSYGGGQSGTQGSGGGSGAVVDGNHAAGFGLSGRKHVIWNKGMLDFNELLAAWCRSMCQAGIPVRQQLEALWAFGIGIGNGGAGPDRSVPLCPYCAAHGGGGHGGFCPNMNLAPADWLGVDA